MPAVKLALAQMDFPVGDLSGNFQRIKNCIDTASAAGAQILLFPELALTGYPPEDLLLRPGFIRLTHQLMQELIAGSGELQVILGHPWEQDGEIYNAASWFQQGQLKGRYFKHCLPNYAVFDERRYFAAGSQPLVVEVQGRRMGLLICEDVWEPQPAQAAAEAGAKLLLIINASPYRRDKLPARNAMLEQRNRETGLPMVYLNLTGGQDELVFDGRATLINGDGGIVALAPICEPTLLYCEYDTGNSELRALDWPRYTPDDTADVYKVLVQGLRDYVEKNGFREVVLGLSGGIDSALTLALAVDAFGAQRVHAVMMPSRHTSRLSLDLAAEQAGLLAVELQEYSIETAYQAYLQLLQPAFAGYPADVTEENLQARCRADILMALSNKFGWIVLSTGNKSELAVGYCTIYGDMAGGFAPIKDCSKTLVYELSRYRNSLSAAIPEAVITRPPSAELAPDQKDQDSLPPYDLLDRILHRYVELDQSIGDIVAAGYEEAVVRRVARLVLTNEYKRRQAAPGVRITHKAFGRDRRYPITSGWRDSGTTV